MFLSFRFSFFSCFVFFNLWAPQAFSKNLFRLHSLSEYLVDNNNFQQEDFNEEYFNLDGESEYENNNENYNNYDEDKNNQENYDNENYDNENYDNENYDNENYDDENDYENDNEDYDNENYDNENFDNNEFNEQEYLNDNENNKNDEENFEDAQDFMNNDNFEMNFLNNQDFNFNEKMNLFDQQPDFENVESNSKKNQDIDKNNENNNFKITDEVQQEKEDLDLDLNASGNMFIGVPPIPGGRRALTPFEAPEEYVVEDGDTLYDICDQLIGEPNYWPKLWAMNPYIKNPHFIWPGMRLKFYLGDEENPPYLEIEKEEDYIPVETIEPTMQKILFDNLVYETHEKKQEKIEFPLFDKVKANKDLFIYADDSYLSSEIELSVPGFIFPQSQLSLCTILGGGHGESLSFLYDQVICDVEEGVELYSKYTVLRYKKYIYDPIYGDFIGYLYYNIGTVEIEKFIDEELSALAKVTEYNKEVMEGDILVPYISSKRSVYKYPDLDNFVDLEAHVVAFNEAEQSFSTEGSVLFIDRGSRSGLNEGNILRIFKNRANFGEILGSFSVPESFEETGYLILIDVREEGSVGYVMQNKTEIYVGDTIGKIPQVLN